MANPNPLVLRSFRGGQNDTSSPNALAEDEVVLARNVEFIDAELGQRRLGCGPFDMTGSGLTGATRIAHLSQWFPTNDPTLAELWAVGSVPDVSAVISKYFGGWSVVTPSDALSPSSPDIYSIMTQALNGKLFIAYHSVGEVDRLHVYANGTLRRAGLAQPNPPTAVNEGADAFTHIRFYRVRFTIQDASGHTVTRSEPSTTLTFTPSGTGKGARVTKSTTIESATHWELEASEDNTTFYRIATTPVGTTTYDDEVSISDGVNPIPAGLSIPPGYVQLSNNAQTLNMTGTVSNGAYSDGITFATRGWVMYTSAGVYVPLGWVGHQPPAAGDVSFASQDVALALETAAGVGTHYANVGVLSEDIGTYLLFPSVKYLTVDGDRLIGASHFTDVARQSSIYWSPVFNDPGVGNDERLPLNVNNTLSLDNFAGGRITGIAAGISGSWYAFKWANIYKMVRTGDVNRAYNTLPVIGKFGAIDGSVVEGADESGASCIYFLDPMLGPCKIGASGPQQIVGLRKTWARVNASAGVVARGVYYPTKQQVIWSVSVDGADLPNFGITIQVSELQSKENNSVGRGLSTWTGRRTEAMAMAMITEIATIGGVTSLSHRPFVGLTAPDFIQRCDTESTDAGVAFTATIRTRPYFIASLLNFWGAMNATLLSAANAATSVSVRLIRDYGIDITPLLPIALAPVGLEEFVIKRLNDLAISEATAVQVEFMDS